MTSQVIGEGLPRRSLFFLQVEIDQERNERSEKKGSDLEVHRWLNAILGRKN